MYTAKINIMSSVKTYKKGEVLGKEFSKTSLDRLLIMGAVFKDGEDILQIEEFDNGETLKFLSEEELRKFKNKTEIVEYARKIGLELDIESTKEKLINDVLNYIEETCDNDDI